MSLISKKQRKRPWPTLIDNLLDFVTYIASVTFTIVFTCYLFNSYEPME